MLFRLGDSPSSTNAEWRCRQVIVNMVTTGEILVPRLDGEPHLTKPPLFYWHGVFWSWVFGDAGRFEQRLPSVLCAAGLLALVYFWGKSAGGRETGIASVICLTLMHHFYSMARQGTYDMQFALFCGLSLFAFDRHLQTRDTRWLPVLVLMLVLGIMTKGPPILMYIGLPVLFFLWRNREFCEVLNKRFWLWLMMVVPLSMVWFVALVILVPDARQVFISQFLLPFGAEVSNPTARHYGPFYYYFEHAPDLLLPLLFFLPAMFIHLWRSRYTMENITQRLCLYAVAAPFCLLSLLPQKQSHYLLPVLAPLAIVCGKAYVEILAKEDLWPYLKIPAAILGTALGVCGLIFTFFFVVAIPEKLWIWIPCVALLFAAGIILVYFGKRQFIAMGICACLVGGWAIILCHYGSLHIWDMQFKEGVVFERSDYDQAHWDSVFQKYPWLKRVFRVKRKEGHVIESLEVSVNEKPRIQISTIS